MDRRNTLYWLGAAALGVSFPAVAYQPTENVPIKLTVPEEAGSKPGEPQEISCRVIGVGDAGSNIALAAWSSEPIRATHCRAGFACVSMGWQSIEAVVEANWLHPDIARIRPVQLGQYGAGGNVNVARAAARKHENTLRSLVDSADVVILVAGLGGGTGSGVTPILASMAQEVGALVLAIVVTPFRWEIGRYPNAFQGVRELERECHYLASLSNQVVGEAMGEDATLDDVITQQEVIGTACIHRLMEDGSRFCIDRRRPTWPLEMPRQPPQS
ncbi:hypothetical protein [Candidatus Aalborgicola defluviihabitans]|uniref:hypothetical protein n=1 Tax=Candidatus Aalborgicola defluviihabitans TaxID=3386187 RepID=UPI001ED0E636|nr:hypothetical protein [Burkholderiales bacterium]